MTNGRFGVVLLLQFGLLFGLVAIPTGWQMHRLLDVTSVVIPLFAIGVASGRKRDRRIAVALALAALAFSGGALSGLRPGNVDVGPMLAAVFSAYATWIMLRGIGRAQQVTGDVLAGALAAYIMAGLAFAVLCGVIEIRIPGSFAAAGGVPVSFPDLVYFSFVTLLTIGFGDVTATAPFARFVVLVEGIFGVVFTTVVMAALVAGYLRHRERVTPD